MNAFTRCGIILALTLAPAWMPTNAFAQDQAQYSQPQLDQMLAPVALYPDPLLSQMFMASTYPLEVVEAAQWSRANPGPKGDDAVNAVADKDWDASVKSLVAFPQVLVWMDQNLGWTRSLGEAFLAQQTQVLDTVQRLRQRAQSAGNLQSDQHVSVVDEGSIIEIEPADPAALYVPYYDPTLVYGNWWWPGYPPAPWQPLPGYYISPGYSAAGLYWSAPIIISTGFFFGNCDWRRHHVRVVNVNNFYYRASVNREAAASGRPVAAVPGIWQHDPAHRRSIGYRLPALQGRFAPAAMHRPEPRPDSPPAPVAPNRGSAPVRPEMHAVIRPATETSPRVGNPQQAGATNPGAGVAALVAPQPPHIRPQAPRPGPARNERSAAPRAIAPFASPEPRFPAVLTPPAPPVPRVQFRAATEAPRMAHVPPPAPRAFAPPAEFRAAPTWQPPGAAHAQMPRPRPVVQAPPATVARGWHDRR